MPGHFSGHLALKATCFVGHKTRQGAMRDATVVPTRKEK
ncbi:hypothetical protein Z950_889 [Sulfitobacter mediterraneus KCTC 32188]|nr:hypothetical protein Z950_889 [Sulfitobacter mediterraneus KCTC 32188]